MKWLLAGASGFLGTALRVRLADAGHEVVRLVRREPATSLEHRWDPAEGKLDPGVFDGVDAVVSLGGVPVFGLPWTAARRKAILSSRVDATRTIAEALATLQATRGTSPVLLSASGVARYGTERTETPQTEESGAAPDFLAQVTVHWEAATRAASDAGVRVVLLRTSPVLGRGGGLGQPLRWAWNVGLGAVLGDGRQRMPMIALEDYLRSVLWLAENPAAHGPYNLTLPEPMTNREFSDALARALHRPRFLGVPAAVIRTALGEEAEQLLGDMYVLPKRLTDAGFEFVAPSVAELVDAALRTD